MKKHITKMVLVLKDRLGWDEAEDRIKKIQVALTILMQLAFLGAFAIALVEGAWESLFISVIAIVAIWLPLFFADSRRIHVPIEFQFLLTAFIYGTLFLGEIQGFYTKFWWWDIVLHAGSGIAFGFLGFLILYSIYYNRKFRDIRPGLLAVFSFCFALSLGTIWEIFEFSMDSILGFNMQKSGLLDTMWDLIVNSLGALLVSISSYFYIRRRSRGGLGLFEHYLVAFFSKNK